MTTARWRIGGGTETRINRKTYAMYKRQSIPQEITKCMWTSSLTCDQSRCNYLSFFFFSFFSSVFWDWKPSAGGCVNGDVTANEDAGPPVGPLGGFKGTRVIQPEVSSPSVTHSGLDEFIHQLQPSASQRVAVSEPDSGTLWDLLSISFLF